MRVQYNILHNEFENKIKKTIYTMEGPKKRTLKLSAFIVRSPGELYLNSD